MKKILFPTDLSENSKDALAYAIAFAAFIKAELHVLHVYELQGTADEFLNLSDTKRKNLAHKLDQQVTSACEDQEHIPAISTAIKAGNPFHIIHTLGKDPAIDLVIMYTKGKDWLESFLLGSTTKAILETRAFPVLICTPGITWQPIKKICFPVDSGPLGKEEQLETLIDIAAEFEAKVMVFHLETETDDLGIHPSFEAALGKASLPFKVSYHYELSEKTILKAINSFGKEYGADMICMLKRKRGSIASFFEKSLTKAEINLADMPFLVLPG